MSLNERFKQIEERFSGELKGLMKQHRSNLTEKFHQLELDLEDTKKENIKLLAKAASNDDQYTLLEVISKLKKEKSSLTTELYKAKRDFAEERLALKNKIEDITKKNNAQKAVQDEVDRLRTDLIDANKTATEWDIEASTLRNRLESTKKEIEGQLEIIAGKTEILIAEINPTNSKLKGQLEERNATALLAAELEQTKGRLSDLECEYNIIVEKLNKSEQSRQKSDEYINHQANQIQNLTYHLKDAETTIVRLEESLHLRLAVRRSRRVFPV
ncbi:hypothetical protein ACHAXS_000403, partial [Conticribra weissflogii]